MWFQRRRQFEQTLQKYLESISSQLQEVLETSRTHKVQVTIHQLHVDEAKLDQLLFRLDRLDIDELSGALNLGNNFGVDVVRQLQRASSRAAVPGDSPDREPGTPLSPEENPPSPDDGARAPHVSATRRGFTVRFEVPDTATPADGRMPQ